MADLKQPGKGIKKEVAVFKDPQQSEIGDQTDKQNAAPTGRLSAAGDAQAAEIVHQGRDQNQGEKPPVPPSVKDIAGGQQRAVLPPVRQNQIQAVDDGKKDEKRNGVKQHGR